MRMLDMALDQKLEPGAPRGEGMRCVMQVAPCNGLSKAFKWTADLRAVEIFRASVVSGHAGAPG
jgi:hypothetical protein